MVKYDLYTVCGGACKINLKHVTMKTDVVAEMRQFYTDVCSFHLIASDTDSFTVQAGDTNLTFEHTEEDVLYHFAFVMEEDTVKRILERPEVQATRMLNADGDASFYSGQWDRPQYYFEDPQTNIVEILPMKDFEHKFMPSGIHLREIGMPVPNLPAFMEQVGVTSEIEPESDTFGFFGGEDGVFVLVQEGRPWYPNRRPATIHPLSVTIAGNADHEIAFPELQYRIRVLPPQRG